MSNVMFTSNETEAEIVAEIEQNYAERCGAMAAKAEALVAAVSRQDESWMTARKDLSSWAQASVTNTLRAEAAHILTAAKQLEKSRALAEEIDAGSDVLASLFADLAGASDAVRAAGSAQAARSVFDLHADNVTTRLVPLMAGESSVSLAKLWTQACAGAGAGGKNAATDSTTSEQAASATPEQTSDCAHGCTCGESDGPEYPELDVRTVPHAIRHATVFGALDSVSADDGMVLVAPHDPLPLLAQIDQRYSGGFSVDYLQSGPEAWRLKFVRARR